MLATSAFVDILPLLQWALSHFNPNLNSHKAPTLSASCIIRSETIAQFATSKSVQRNNWICQYALTPDYISKDLLAVI
jgi:hypothetical protein